MAKGITAIEFAHDLGDSPASTHRPSGRVWVNSRFIGKHMRKCYWHFILDHEEGHIRLNTKSEKEADEYASTKFFNKHPNDPWASVEALEQVLPMNTPEHRQRVEDQKQRVRNYLKQNSYLKPNTMYQYAMPQGIPGGPGHYAQPEGIPLVPFKMINPPQPGAFSNFTPTAKVFTSLSWRCRQNPNAAGCKEPMKASWYCQKPENMNKPQCNPAYASWNCLANPNGPGCREPRVFSLPVAFSSFNPGYNEEYSNFVNCNKYVIKKRRQNCEAENERERQAQIELAKLNNASALSVSQQQAGVATGLGSLLAQTGLDQPAITPETETSGMNTTYVIIGLVAAAAVIGAVLYFMRKKPA